MRLTLVAPLPAGTLLLSSDMLKSKKKEVAFNILFIPKHLLNG